MATQGANHRMRNKADIDDNRELAGLLERIKDVALASGDPSAVAPRLFQAARELAGLALESTPEESLIEPAHQNECAAKLYAARRVRDRVFGNYALFGEPAWDILLDIVAAEGTGKRVSITDACIASSVPLTTALRWIGALEKHGLVERSDDKNDARRSWIMLTAEGYRLMASYFAELEIRDLIGLPSGYLAESQL
jgi:DNA-binding MarR family transcriptional regulator